MNEDPNQNLKIDEAETLERELAAAPEWAGFGQVLAAAHEIGRASCRERV